MLHSWFWKGTIYFRVASSQYKIKQGFPREKWTIYLREWPKPSTKTGFPP